MYMSPNLIMAIGAVSQDVAADLDTLDGGDNDAMVVAEITIDAGRLRTWGHTEADEEIKKLINEYGYDAVLTAVSTHVYVD